MHVHVEFADGKSSDWPVDYGKVVQIFNPAPDETGGIVGSFALQGVTKLELVLEGAETGEAEVWAQVEAQHVADVALAEAEAYAAAQPVTPDETLHVAGEFTGVEPDIPPGATVTTGPEIQQDPSSGSGDPAAGSEAAAISGLPDTADTHGPTDGGAAPFDEDV